MSGVAFRANSIDVAIGQTLSILRRQQGLTQKDLAEKANVTFQQIQKYETASNRISASRLLLLADVLEVPISVFFETVRSDYVRDKNICELLKTLPRLSDNDKTLVFTLVRRLAS